LIAVAILSVVFTQNETPTQEEDEETPEAGDEKVG